MIYFAKIKAEIKQGEPRPGWTYRGSRRNADRADAKWEILRALRRQLGLSRARFNRWQAGQSIEDIQFYLRNLRRELA